MNTARGHFDKKKYDSATVVTPREFLKLTDVAALLIKLGDNWFFESLRERVEQDLNAIHASKILRGVVFLRRECPGLCTFWMQERRAKTDDE